MDDIFFRIVILSNRQYVLFANGLRFSIFDIVQCHLYILACAVHIINGKIVYRGEAIEVSVSNGINFININMFLLS